MRRLGPLLVLLGIFACAAGKPPQDATRDDTGPVAYTMVENQKSGVEMPRISLPGRPDVEQRVNEQLDAHAASLMCLDPEPGSYNASADVTHAANDVFSVHVGVSYYCGGAYPVNHADSSITFDLRIGEAVRFQALFADYERDGAGIARAYIGSLSAEDLEGCEDVLTVEELDEHFFAYTISTEGLRVEPSFPHVLEVCNRDSIVPFDELRAFAAPGGILTRVADAAPEGS